MTPKRKTKKKQGKSPKDKSTIKAPPSFSRTWSIGVITSRIHALHDVGLYAIRKYVEEETPPTSWDEP